MVKRCCVKECKSSQKDEVQVSYFRLPSADKEPQERNKWIDVLCKVNEYLVVSTETVVCSKHWPLGYRVTRKRGHDRPFDPPSVFGDFMKKSHGTALANIFLKQLCKSVTPRDGKESKQKVIKLSV